MKSDQRGRLTLAIEAYGVVIAIELSDPALAGPVGRILPPGHVPADPATARVAFTLSGGIGETFVLTEGSEQLAEGVGLDDAVGLLDASIRRSIAAGSPEMIFVHAGVVAHRGRGLLLPGASFTGKTELVAALLRAGATYYSDEFAVLDSDGLVHPYPRRLSIRDRESSASRDVGAEELGASTGVAPVGAAIIAVTRYLPQAIWQPAVQSPAFGVMRLLAHAGQARGEPERALHALDLAVRRGIILEGPRGEAEPTAIALLAQLDELDARSRAGGPGG